MANTILNRQKLARFVELIAEGNYFVTACGVLGFSEQDAYNWLAWGKENKDAQGPDPAIYRDFFESVTRAEAEAEAAAVKDLREAGKPQDFDVTEKGFAYPVVRTAEGTKLRGETKAVLEFLARRYRQRWAATEKHEVSGPGGGPQEHTVAIQIVPPKEKAVDNASGTDAPHSHD